jgi:hypothetical protein
MCFPHSQNVDFFIFKISIKSNPYPKDIEKINPFIYVLSLIKTIWCEKFEKGAFYGKFQEQLPLYNNLINLFNHNNNADPGL